MEKHEKKEKKKHARKISMKKLCMYVMIVVVLMIAGFLTVQYFGNKNKKPEIITTSTLQKIINVSELSTFEATYKGIAIVYNEKRPEKIDFYVSYEAKIKAGIDFEKVDIHNDDVNKKIIVKIPEIELKEPEVDIASMEYIFVNKKANQSAVSEKAYKACIEDVKRESEREDAIYDLAKQNAENIIMALLKPFVEDMDAEYEIVVD